MKVARSFRVAAPRDDVWELFCDVPRTAACIDAVRSIEPAGDGAYEGTVHVKMGPIVFLFDGRVELLGMDAEAFTGAMRARARDPRTAAGLGAEMQFKLLPAGASETDLAVVLDVTLTGKVAELGQPLIHRKIGDMLGGFGQRVEALLRRMENA